MSKEAYNLHQVITDCAGRIRNHCGLIDRNTAEHISRRLVRLLISQETAWQKAELLQRPRAINDLSKVSTFTRDS